MKLTCLIVSTLLIVFISQQSTNALPIDDLTTQHSCLEGFELINGECHPVLSSTQESVTESTPSEFAKVTLSYEVTTVENKKLGESEDCPKGKVLSKTGVCEDIIFEDQLSTTPKSKKLKETPEEHDNEPLDHTTEAVESEHKPKVLTDKPVEHDNEPLDHTTEPVEGEHKPVEHEKELLDHTTEPVEDEHKPVDDEDKPIEDEHKPKPKPKMHKGGPVEDELHPHPHPHPHKDGPMEDEREPKPKVHKVRPVEDEPKPIDHEDDKPVEDERKPKPKVHKIRPVEDEPKPIDHEDKPVEDERKPKPIDHEDDKPVEDERKPKPIDHEDKPVEDERKPKPKIHKIRPVEDEPKPKPIDHEDKPVEDENEPSAVNEEKSDIPKGCPPGTKVDEQGACQDEIEHSTTTLKMNLKDLLPKDGSCPPGMELFKEKCIYIKSKDNLTMDDSTNIEENKSDKVVLEDKLVSMLKGGVCPPDTEYYSNGLCRIRTSPSSSNILIVKEKCQADEILIDGKCQRKEVELIKTSSISPKTKPSNEDEDKPVESL